MADKSRIMDHMNKDHKLALYDYLAYFKNIRLDIDDPNNDVELTDIELDSLKISYKTATATKSTNVPIIPPMASLSDAREAFRRMAKEAASGTGVEIFRLKSYIPPSIFAPHQNFPASLFGLNLHFPGSFLVILLCLTPVFPKPLKWLWTTLLPQRAAEYLIAKSIKTALALMAIHSGEVLFVLLPLMRRLRVPAGPRALWMVSNLFEGYPTLLRLQGEMNRRKH